MLHRYGKLGPFMAVLFVAVAVTVLGTITMLLWNALMPELFGLSTISFLQAIGLIVLTRIFFHGSHGHKYWQHHNHDSHWSTNWHKKHGPKEESEVVADTGEDA